MISRPEIQAFLGTYQEGAEKFPVHLQLHPGVDPSSIFLTGSSGSGKSTAGQCMAIQFAKQRTPLLALDLGHTLSPDHICPPLSSEFEALAIRHDLYNESVATDILNPKPCGSNTESPYDTAYGLCQIIGQNNRFGPAQIASLTAEVKTIVEHREICPHIFPSILKALKSSTSANVRMLGNRLEPLLQHDVFERRQNGSSSLPISPHIHIFDVSSYPDTIRTTLAELAVGIRAHDFAPCAPGTPNSLPVQAVSTSENPFDWNMIFTLPGGEARLWWKVSKETMAAPPPKAPACLAAAPENIMPLV